MTTQPDSYRRSELHYAANERDADKVNLLIQKGADVNLADKNQWTPLHFAAQSGSAECAQLLLNAGAKVDAVDSNGNTPLWRATFESRGNGDVIRLLRSFGADPSRKNESGVSPVELARTIATVDVGRFYADWAG